MFRPVKQKNPGASVLYFLGAVSLVGYAAPKLRQNTVGWHGVFQIAWLVFAILVMAANLWFVMGVTGSQKARNKEQGHSLAHLSLPGKRTAVKQERKRNF